MRRHAVVVGMMFGDEGKGSVVDWLTGRHGPVQATPGKLPFGTVVRFNGGAQAGHRVVAADGRSHVFSQFGSGTFNGAMTHLSRLALVDPLALLLEAESLRSKIVDDPLRRVTIDREALLVTPLHAAANKAREAARGDGRHGSCGMGIGEAQSFALLRPDEAPRVGDTQDRKLLRRRLWALHDHLVEEVPGVRLPPIDPLLDAYREFANWAKIVDRHYLSTILPHQRVVFEGAQGVLLDQDHGFHPYTTWSRTTPANALELLRDAGQDGEGEVVGVLRPWTTRHGVGPFPSEVPGMAAELPDENNVDGAWQGTPRAGDLDLVLLRYAAAVARPDAVALTCMDRVEGRAMRACGRYAHAVDLRGFVDGGRPGQEYLTASLSEALPMTRPMSDPSSEVAAAAGAPVIVEGWGPKAEHKRVPVTVA